MPSPDAKRAPDRLASIAAAEFGVPFLSLLSVSQEAALAQRYPDLVASMEGDVCDRDVRP